MKKFILTIFIVLIMVLPVFADHNDQIIDTDITRHYLSADDTVGLKSVILSLIGPYETIITDYTYETSPSGIQYHSVSIERDISWIWSCIIFVVVIFCVFRIIGGLLCR